MAVVEVSNVKSYIGLAGDTKPASPAGSTFFATDTQVWYVYDGSTWRAQP